MANKKQNPYENASTRLKALAFAFAAVSVALTGIVADNANAVHAMLIG